MAGTEGLQAHLASGVTTVARAWDLRRRDGTRLGFTDHDRDLVFDGLVFRAGTGLAASALAQATGLSVDNTEAMGALSDSCVREVDIDAGRYDGAQVTAWLVNWADVTQRRRLFRGHIGEIRRAHGAFRAELRGVADALNRPVGRVYQKPCSAVLGDGRCRVDLTQPEFQLEADVLGAEDGWRLDLPRSIQHAPGWFQRGHLQVLNGASSGLSAAIKRDLEGTGVRRIELWDPLRAGVQPGDRVLLTAGCDKRFETCRDKFANVLNYAGFPHLPSDDWLLARPASRGGAA